MWGWFWGGDIFLAFYAIPSFLEKINYGNKKINIFLFYRKTIVDRDSGNLYPILYKKKKMVVLASEPVGGRSRATELPCLFSILA